MLRKYPSSFDLFYFINEKLKLCYWIYAKYYANLPKCLDIVFNFTGGTKHVVIFHTLLLTLHYKELTSLQQQYFMASVSFFFAYCFFYFIIINEVLGELTGSNMKGIIVFIFNSKVIVILFVYKWQFRWKLIIIGGILIFYTMKTFPLHLNFL
jgi:hypothetical protein